MVTKTMVGMTKCYFKCETLEATWQSVKIITSKLKYFTKNKINVGIGNISPIQISSLIAQFSQTIRDVHQLSKSHKQYQ